MQWPRASGWAAALLAGAAILSGLFVAAAPTYAAAPVPVTVSVTSPARFAPGTQHAVAFTVTNGTPGVGEDTSLTATITIAPSGGSASQDFTFTAGAGCSNAGSVGNTCRFRFPENGAGAVRSLSFVVAAASTVTDVPAGATTTFGGSAISVSSTTPGSTPAGGGFSVTLDGPAAGSTGAPAPTTIAGVVDDAATGLPLVGARVTLRDAAARAYTTTTDGVGRFSFAVTAAHPVAGPFVIAVSTAGYQQFTSARHAFTPGIDVTNLTELVHPLATAGAPAPATAPATQTASTSGLLPPATAGPAGTDPASQINAAIAGARAGSPSNPLDYILITGAALLGAAAIVLVYLLVRPRRDEDARQPVSAPPADDDTLDTPEMAAWPPRAFRAPRAVIAPQRLAPSSAWQAVTVRTLPPRPPAPAAHQPGAATQVDDDLLGADPAPPTRPSRHGTRPADRSSRVRIYGVDGYHGEPLDRTEGDQIWVADRLD